MIVGQTDHGHWAGFVFAIEWCGLCCIKGAAVPVGIVRVVEPEADVEGISRRQGRIRIETEDLVEQDGLDGSLELPQTVGPQVTLVPSKPEVGEIGIWVSVCQQVAALHGKHIEGQMRPYVISRNG